MSLRIVFTVAFLLVASTAAAHSDPAPKPTFPTLTEKEEQKLRNGKLVMTQQVEDGAGAVTGIIEINATPAEVWKILVNFEGLPESTPNIKEVDRYTDKTEGAKRIIDIGYMLKVAWIEIRYWVHHDYFPDQQYLVWNLDSSKKNEIAATTGSFSTWPGSGAGKTRYLYITSVDTGRSIPDWVEEDLTESSLKKYMKFVKTKAEK
jgi:hypothetical protein